MEKSFFDEVLGQLVRQSGQSLPRLAELSGVAQKTIESWLEGRVKRPREWRELLRVARAMRLTLQETNDLLASARHQPLRTLLAEARDKSEQAALELLAFWAEAQERHGEAVQRSQTAIFQAVPALTQLVGREREYEQLKNTLISGGRICVLRGMSGVGKTVLAAKAANELRPFFPDGVFWAQVDKSNVDAILRSFAKAYGQDVSEYHDEGTLSANVRNIFANKRALIVLDGVYSRESIAALLPPTTGGTAVIIATTSHKLLEHEAILIDLKPFDTQGSLALFAARLGQARVNEAQDDFEQIVRLVGGLPLALKIIASNLPAAMTVREYYELLRDEEIRRLHLYEGDEDSKQVRLSFEVSYKLLPERWKKLIGYLSLFKGVDFSAEAVAAVANLPVSHVKMDLNHLLTMSLIETGSGGDALPKPLAPVSPPAVLDRYRQHTLLAFFGAEKFAQDFSEMVAVCRQRAATYYAEFAQRNLEKYALLELEWGNLFASLPWLLEDEQPRRFNRTVDALTAFQLGVAGFLDGQGHWRAAIQWLEAMQSARGTMLDPLEQAIVHTKLGLFHLRLAELELADLQLQQALIALVTVAESEAAVRCQAYAYEAQAQVRLAQGLAEQASACVAQGIAALQRFQRKAPGQAAALSPVEGYLLVRHATIAARTGDLITAQAEIEQALAKLPPAPTAARVSALLTLGNLHELQGQAAQAEESFLAGVDAATAIGDNRRLADLWSNLAIHAEEKGDFAACVSDNKKALDLYRRIGDVVGQGAVASNLSVNYLRQGQPDAALTYIQEAQGIATAHQAAHLGRNARVNLAHYHLLRAEYPEASGLLTEARRQCEQLGESETLAEILRLQAQVAGQQGAYDEALKLIDASLQMAGANEWEAAASRQVQTEMLSLLGKLAAMPVTPSSNSSTSAQPAAIELAIQRISSVSLTEPKRPSTQVTILFLAADPTSLARLRLGKELHDIEEQLTLAQQRERFALHQSMVVRAQDVTRAILEKAPTIVHFSGHGLASGEICLEDESGQAQPVPTAALVTLFRLVAGHVQCVVLSACYSAQQAIAIAQHIQYVIGMSNEISDQTALAFTIGFYQALGAGQPIPAAYEWGCAQIQLQGSPEYLFPVLMQK